MKAPTLIELYAKLSRRKKAYQLSFGPPGTAGYDMLVDLAKFTRAFDADMTINDPNQAMILVGMRRAFFRVFSHCHLEPEELAQLYRAVHSKEGDN